MILAAQQRRMVIRDFEVFSKVGFAHPASETRTGSPQALLASKTRPP